MCNLEDGVIECYINRLTVNTYFGYNSLRPDNCFDFSLIKTSIIFFENINYSFCIGILTSLLFFIFCCITGEIFFGYICVHLVQCPIICCCCSSCNTFNGGCCIGGTIFLFPVFVVIPIIIVFLYDLSSIYFFFRTLFNIEYWDMFNIKLPNFDGLHLDLGTIYNKNIIFLIKITVYFLLICFDLMKSINFSKRIVNKKDNLKEIVENDNENKTNELIEEKINHEVKKITDGIDSKTIEMIVCE